MSEPSTGTPSARPDASVPSLHAALADVLADPHARPLLVALDFDGTLAPLQDDPQLSRILPAGVDVLARLAAADGVELALVSGRAMADLHALAEVPPGTFLVGSHGAERARVTRFGLDRDVVQLTDEQADRLATLGAQAAQVARGRDGVWVETKPTAVVVHTRLAEPDVAEPAEAEAVALGERLGSGVLHGKDVVEISVLHASKGEALQALRGELGAPVVLYAGDDVTDEHAFAALGDRDLTVKVGAGTTVARFRLDSPETVVSALAHLARTLGA
ncbi:trehalose-phosphatase [Cellulomonas fimi]|uniref:Trehalose 6-phosphate phosphatase n=1 Tax=Cellulomonas fimi (strain ATCC 484 / DSM 20113 / JCM 1341 / CCUG 24087 / LMG 16345 / NBRC 15513 / NCIMB 8980 / NCTC 7547 / NRS-133) TaxID=590998 RepID=F4GY89_CELFA|nr:trehalose-phosphatase [Cellulomonas fimi]AEE44757.1 trehalose-phosphatase [Cellulomonas fimi ATCC 484]NNH06102.1 trehalose-phosphatase [Cellulomonas fimi]VEH27207.1 Trehalose-phosphate phosphatase [Cellulomonas fimi]